VDLPSVDVDVEGFGSALLEVLADGRGERGGGESEEGSDVDLGVEVDCGFDFDFDLALASLELLDLDFLGFGSVRL